MKNRKAVSEIIASLVILLVVGLSSILLYGITLQNSSTSAFLFFSGG